MGDDEFPAAELGDSDTVRVGDWAYVVGNPFLLADDFKPTVTYGIISGVHRYQYPAGTLLEYADCLQTDAAINPGNSGGPLFDAAGQLIGINGRGSFEKRGRVNVGVGYAISINQIKRFLGLLKSGRIVDHASLGATVTTDPDGRVVVDDILDDSDAFRRGLRYGDELVRFGDREIGSAERVQERARHVSERLARADHVSPRRPRSSSGACGWPACIARASWKRCSSGARAAGARSAAAGDEPQPPATSRSRTTSRRSHDPATSQPRRTPAIAAPRGATATAARPCGQYYEESPGYANYWFNRYHQQRVWNAYLARGDFAETGWNWKIAAQDRSRRRRRHRAHRKERLDHDARRQVGGRVRSVAHRGNEPAALRRTAGRAASVAAAAARRARGASAKCITSARCPGRATTNLADCLVAIHGGVETRFYFDPTNGDLVGIEMQASDDEDPCEIYFNDIREVDGRSPAASLDRPPRRRSVRGADGQVVRLVGNAATDDKK